MSRKCRAFSKSKLGLEPADNRKAFYAGWEAALAQPEPEQEPVQEPVAVHQFREQHCVNWYDGHPDHSDGGGPYEERTLYTAPPQRKPLTEEEIWALYYALPSDDFERSDRIDFARAIERAHGIKEKE